MLKKKNKSSKANVTDSWKNKTNKKKTKNTSNEQIQLKLIRSKLNE